MQVEKADPGKDETECLGTCCHACQWDQAIEEEEAVSAPAANANASEGKHATAHFEETGHPVIRSHEPDETWCWCYQDELQL